VANLERRDTEGFGERHEVVVVVVGIQLIEGRMAVDEERRGDVYRVFRFYVVVPDDLSRRFGCRSIKLPNDDPLVLTPTL
jgi:hypothetical protein